MEKSTYHILTHRSLSPEVKKSLPSTTLLMEVIRLGCAINPIVLLGFPSNGNLIIPTTFYLVAYAKYLS